MQDLNQATPTTDSNIEKKDVSIGDMPVQTWKNFKKLAAVHEVKLPEMLEIMVNEKLKEVGLDNAALSSKK